MLCSANFQGQGFFFGAAFDTGTVTDFNSAWFDNFGDTIVGAMKFNVWYPIANEVVWKTIRWTKQMNDYYRATGTSTTRCTTIQQYVNIHCGA